MSVWGTFSCWSGNEGTQGSVHLLVELHFKFSDTLEMGCTIYMQSVKKKKINHKKWKWDVLSCLFDNSLGPLNGKIKHFTKLS